MPAAVWPRFDIERSSVRAVLLDPDGRFLLFRTVDTTMPELGEWWELPGGGVEPGESVVETAVRELAEETGLLVPPAAVGEPTWRRDTTYVHRHVRVLQHEVVVVAHIDVRAPALRSDGRTPEELDAYVGHRWWTPRQVQAAAASTRFFPGTLPEHLDGLLAGEPVVEPLDIWN